MNRTIAETNADVDQYNKLLLTSLHDDLKALGIRGIGVSNHAFGFDDDLHMEADNVHPNRAGDDVNTATFESVVKPLIDAMRPTTCAH